MPNPLLDNPIADMYGPTFLLFYGSVIVVTCIVCAFMLRAEARAEESVQPSIVPENLDPYEIAYLRGGEGEVANTIIFTLIQRGYLRQSSEYANRIERVGDLPREGFLSAQEYAVLEWFSSPRTGKEIFRPTGGLKQQLAGHFQEYRQRLMYAGLLYSEGKRQLTWKLWLCGAFLIAALGAYKLYVAVATMHTNVAFLIIMGVIGLVVLAFACRLPRQTRRGRNYLQRLQFAFSSLRNPADNFNAAPDSSYILAVGLFGAGAGILASTPYGYYQEMHRSTMMASTGGSSYSGDGGSSSRCSGGSSCGGGGGCGGCGGGS